MQLLLHKIKEAYKNKLPFVSYNKPNETTVRGLFQKDASLNTITSGFNEPGFVFAPFNTTDTTVFFPLDQSDFVKATYVDLQIEFNHTQQLKSPSKKSHITIVEKAVSAIKNNEFKKVVISRKEILSLSGVDVEEIYMRLLKLYPNAFVYVWFHPLIGLWFGATPETLLKVENNNFTTMSLAGTQVYKKNEEVIWNPKEIEEQQIVTEYILHKLSKFSTNLEQSKTKTVKAGSLLHLSTEIKGKLLNKELFSLVDLLHPTPAVCGFPKDKAKQYILENENYNRSYYTGYLGELNMESDSDSHLFVNLRCMEIRDYKAAIYVGGGITHDSNPEKEWEETVAKSNVMLKVL